jgi:UDP-N-acetylglucosamine 4,6-dehydratase
MKIYNKKTILITGGTGTFGQAYVSNLSKNKYIKKIIVFSRDELKQSEMAKKYPKNKFSNIRFFIGDVRDLERLKIALHEVDYVVHAAALKQVPTVEYNPFEAIKTNIIGTQNIIDAAWYNKVKKVIALSTDKACSPLNFYGATKLCLEKLLINSSAIKSKDTNFVVVRYGNVMGSRGSILDLMKNNRLNKFNLTDPRMTRFHIRIKSAIEMVDYAFQNLQGGEILIPKIQSIRIKDLVEVVYGRNNYNITGIRPGEKIHEQLMTESESFNGYENNRFYLIGDPVDLKKIKKKFNKIKKPLEYVSNKNSFLSKNQIFKEIKNIL